MSGFLPLYSIGELITAYDAGYHRVTRVEERHRSAPLIHYTKVLNEDGSKGAKKTGRCDASFCRKVDAEWIEQQFSNDVAAAERKRHNLIAALGGN